MTHSCLAPGSPTLLDLSECIIPIIVYLPCCFVIHLYANGPTEVSRFLVVTRAYVWFNLFQLFSSNLEWKKSGRVGIHTTLQSIHFTQRIHRRFREHVCHPQGSLQSRYQAWQASRPPPVIWATWAPRPTRHIREQRWEGTARSGCGPRSPPPLPLHGNAATEKPVHLLRKWKRGHKCQQSQHPPLPSLLNFLLKVTAVHSSHSVFSEHLPLFHGWESSLGKSELKKKSICMTTYIT